MTGLRRIVLVHGAAHGAWCWERMVPRLANLGFEVDTLDLPGLGDDQTPARLVTFESYVDAVARVVGKGASPVLLLGHSMGGLPVSAVAEAMPERVGKLIYLASFMPQDGDVIAELAGSMARFGETTAFECMRPSAVEGAHECDPKLAGNHFYNTCAPDIAAAAVARLRPQADAPLGATLHLSAERYGAIPKTYIVCEKDRALPVSAQHWFCARTPAAKKRTLDTDHSPFYSDPDGLARIIAEEA